MLRNVPEIQALHWIQHWIHEYWLLILSFSSYFKEAVKYDFYCTQQSECGHMCFFWLPHLDYHELQIQPKKDTPQKAIHVSSKIGASKNLEIISPSRYQPENTMNALHQKKPTKENYLHWALSQVNWAPKPGNVLMNVWGDLINNAILCCDLINNAMLQQKGLNHQIPTRSSKFLFATNWNFAEQPLLSFLSRFAHNKINV